MTGPYQPVKSPQKTELDLGNLEERGWPTAFLLSSAWTLFPHVSTASFGEEGGDRGCYLRTQAV